MHSFVVTRTILELSATCLTVHLRWLLKRLPCLGAKGAALSAVRAAADFHLSVYSAHSVAAL